MAGKETALPVPNSSRNPQYVPLQPANQMIEMIDLKYLFLLRSTQETHRNMES